MNRTTSIISWIARIGAAVILLQTLFFKFTGHPDSVYIFSELGVEPWGRIGLGVAELITAILLLVPRTAWLGALTGVGMMSGALLSHLTMLGVVLKYPGNPAGDGGGLFALAAVTFVLCAIVLYLHRAEIRLPFLKSGQVA